MELIRREQTCLIGRLNNKLEAAKYYGGDELTIKKGDGNKGTEKIKC